MTLTDLLTVKRELNKGATVCNASGQVLRRRPAGLAWTCIGLSMGCVKDDDADITWDSEAMRHGKPWRGSLGLYAARTILDAMGRQTDRIIIQAFHDNRIEL